MSDGERSDGAELTADEVAFLRTLQEHLTVAQLLHLKASYERSVECGKFVRSMIFAAAKWLMIAILAGLGWLLSTGAREWITNLLTP